MKSNCYIYEGDLFVQDSNTQLHRATHEDWGKPNTKFLIYHNLKFYTLKEAQKTVFRLTRSSVEGQGAS